MAEFPIPTPEDLRDQYYATVEAEFPTIDPRLERSLIGTMGKATALGIHGNYLFAKFISRQIFVATAEAEFLDQHGNEYGVDRIEARGSSGKVTATGADPTLIPLGTELKSGNDVLYQTKTSVALSGGTATLEVESVDFGADTNQDAAVTLSFVNPIVGVDSEATVDAPGLEGGNDRETDDLYRERILFRKRNPIQCGTVSDYEQWAKEIADVTRVDVFPLEDGPGTVRVRFMTDNLTANGIPPASKVTEVQANIDSKRPINVPVVVSAPVAVVRDFAIRVTPFTPEIVASVELEIEDLMFKDAKAGGGLKISRVREAVSNAEGEFDNIVDDPAGDVAAGAPADILVTGTITVTELV